MANIVLLKGRPIHKEGIASEAITPGDLLEFVPSGGDAGELRKHANAAQNASPMFAREEEYVGGGLTDAYADGDKVAYYVCRPGDEVNARLASGQNVAKGAFLESAGNGQLRAHSAVSGQHVYVKAVVGQAMVATDAAAGATRIHAEVL